MKIGDLTLFVVAQIAGVALLVLGGQGLVRLLFDRADGGWAESLPGGFWAWAGTDVVLIVAGSALGVWAQRRRGER